MALDTFFIRAFVSVALASMAICRCNISRKEGHLVVKCRKERHFPIGLPPEVKDLDLKGCILQDLSRSDMSKFKQLRSFIANGCHIRRIELGTFDDNLELESLDLSRNPDIEPSLKVKTICHISQVNIRIKVLNLAVMNIGSAKFILILRCLEKMKLSALDLSSNKIGRLKDHIFGRLTSLLDLRLSNTYPVNVRAFTNLTLLQTLRLGNNELMDFPNFVDKETNKTLLPSLTALYLDYNRIRSLPGEPVGLERLEFLNLRGNQMINITSAGMVKVLPSVKTLFLNTNTRFRLDQSSFNPNLIRLELRDCHGEYSWETRNIFRGLKNMVGLSVSNSHFNGKNKTLGYIFKGMTKLSYLTVDDCGIKEIPDESFRDLVYLKLLSLNHNKISSLSPVLFKDLRSLEKLYLNYNRLTLIRDGSISSLLGTLQIVDLSYNPYACDCNLLWFLKFYGKTEIVIANKNYKGAYMCLSPRELFKVELSSVNMTDADCRHLSLGTKLGISLSSVLVVTACFTLLVYRFRWYMSYAYFLLRAKRREARERNDGIEYAYDAFVVYNRNDVIWVKDKLLPVLEDTARLKLCVHDRDWLCGRDVMDNIVQSIESSRKVLLVVSNAFAISQWCHLEMTLAQHRLQAEDRNALVLVLLERIERKNITPRLLLQMRRQTYLEWTEDPTGQRLFWKKLRRAVQKPVGSIIHGSSVHQQAPHIAEDSIAPLLGSSTVEAELTTCEGNASEANILSE
ncbi:hypothetical protein LSH36_901g01004 [Paralvinella palmiformis]|uniref:TIR domain-containing protein n=1 Tax=Paralvinella palmiformis TaxID=53620 RepID=A0AAD9MSU7_9ANNE|nr:hypothetical protein LSH36_901g01004 [Paralvinella palmiformis]